jgi:hypothetical protein
MTSDKICAYQKYGPGTLDLTFNGLKITECLGAMCSCTPLNTSSRLSKSKLVIWLFGTLKVLSHHMDSTSVHIKDSVK